MSPSPAVRVERDGGVAHVVLDRAEKRNALDAALIAETRAALAEADADAGVRVVTLSGAGKDFCAGADLGELRRSLDDGLMAQRAAAEQLAELLLLPLRMEKPVVALVRGRALAGGCGLALACDLILAADDAEFGLPEVELGFVPAMVAALVGRDAPPRAALELLLGGPRWSAAHAERLGVVNRVFPARAFETEARSYLSALAERDPAALRLTKRLFHDAEGSAAPAALRAGLDVNVVSRAGPALRARVDRFLEGGRGG